MRRYTFAEVKRALDQHWGLTLSRGNRGVSNVNDRDGRWDVTHSVTGFIVSGKFPGCRYRHVRYRSLAQIVRVCELAEVIAAWR